MILEDRGGEGRGREQVQVDDARRRGIRVIRRENTYSPISIATLSATPTTCSPRQEQQQFLAKLQILGTVSEFTNMVLVTLEDELARHRSGRGRAFLRCGGCTTH